MTAVLSDLSSNKRLNDDLLLAYATGKMSEGESLLTAVHASMNQEINKKIWSMQNIGGAFLEEHKNNTIKPELLDSIIEKLETVSSAHSQISSQNKEFHAQNYENVLPFHLMDYLQQDQIENLSWKIMGAGLYHYSIWEGNNNQKVWLLRAKPGIKVPEHSHSGLELTLVLSGSYNIDKIKFERGDVETATIDTHHQPLIGGEDECVCLVLTQGRLRFKSPLVKLIQPFIGL